MEFFKSVKGAVLIAVLSVAVVAAIFLSLLFGSKGQFEKSFFYSMDAMIEVIGDNQTKKDAEEIFKEAEGIFDCYNKDSEVSKLNRETSIFPSDKLIEAIYEITDLCDRYGDGADITVGALTSLWDITGDNPRVPEQSEIDKALETVGYENIIPRSGKVTLINGAKLDFGCAAKGAALDYLKKRLDERQAEKSIISAGASSILLYGDGSFTTKIMSPEDENGILGELHTEGGFISTSGGYHRFAEIDGKKYIHILDTNTGYPSETDLTSVTVFCDSGIASDFMSTLIFAGGSENLEKFLKDDEFRIVAVDSNKKVYVSEGLDFEITNDSFTLAE